jgi:hypothetical protein
MKLILATLALGIAALGLTPARADTIISLENVTFDDGATASGTFAINIYGYLDWVNIATTPGTSQGSQPMAGYTYTSGLLLGSTQDAVFAFNSIADAMSLVLAVNVPLVPAYTGADALVTGSASGTPFTGSSETCQENASACDGPGYQDGRLVTGGDLYVPEPATLGLLAIGALLTTATARRRTWA